MLPPLAIHTPRDQNDECLMTNDEGRSISSFGLGHSFVIGHSSLDILARCSTPFQIYLPLSSPPPTGPAPCAWRTNLKKKPATPRISPPPKTSAEKSASSGAPWSSSGSPISSSTR